VKTREPCRVIKPATAKREDMGSGERGTGWPALSSTILDHL